MEEYSEYLDFRYIDASVSTGSLASSEKSLLRSSECSSIHDEVDRTNKKKKGGLKLEDIELIKLRTGQSSAAVAVKKVTNKLHLIFLCYINNYT